VASEDGGRQPLVPSGSHPWPRFWNLDDRNSWNPEVHLWIRQVLRFAPLESVAGRVGLCGGRLELGEPTPCGLGDCSRLRFHRLDEAHPFLGRHLLVAPELAPISATKTVSSELKALYVAMIV
jgi:hypothetical protein